MTEEDRSKHVMDWTVLFIKGVSNFVPPCSHLPTRKHVNEEQRSALYGTEKSREERAVLSAHAKKGTWGKFTINGVK